MLSEHLHEEHAHGVGFWDEFSHLLTNGPHWAFEGVTDVVFTAVGVVFGALIWKRVKERWHHQFDREHGLSHSENAVASGFDANLSDPDSWDTDFLWTVATTSEKQNVREAVVAELKRRYETRDPG